MKKLTNEERYKQIVNKLDYDNNIIYDSNICYTALFKLLTHGRLAAVLTQQPKCNTQLDEVIGTVVAFGKATTVKKMLYCYGDTEGTKKWEAYRKIQSETNTFEYKQQKYGWTIDQFEKYNQSRSVTYENVIKRHGKDKGDIVWNNYIVRQAYTNTLEHLGKDRYAEVNKAKTHCFETYFDRYGNEEIAIQKLESYWSSKSSVTFCSKISQIMAWDIYNTLSEEEKAHSYFNDLNKEYVVVTKEHCFKYDFVCTSLKLCVEFHGDHYHGNPKLYHPSDLLKGKGQSDKGITASIAWLNDAIKEQQIVKARGYLYIVVWETDWNKDKNIIISKINNIINEIRNENIAI